MKAEEAWYSNSYAEKKTKEESERNYQNYEKHNMLLMQKALSNLSLWSVLS